MRAARRVRGTDNTLLQALNLLIQYKADVNSRTNTGRTPLIGAVSQNRQEISNILLQHGAVINSADKKGDTALHAAVKNDNTDIADILIKTGADPGCGYRSEKD